MLLPVTGRRSWGVGCLAVASVLLSISAVPASARQVPAAAEREPAEALLLIVDFSGSMLESDGQGSTRIASAKRALATIIEALPENLDVGLRVYGHRVPSADKPRACQDTELVVPVGPLDRELLGSTVQGLEALGETPIGLSLQQAAADLPEGKPSTVILVSDGADECFPDLGPDPCTVTKDLIASGIDLRLETIGLQVEQHGKAQLECMAAAGGGEFTSVEDAGLLADALAGARNRAARTFEPRGTPVAGGPSLIDAAAVGPGTYTDGIVAGESLWFAVAAEQGQNVTARATVATSGVSRDAGIVLEWQDENAKRVELAALDGLTSGQANTLAASTGEITGSRSPYGAVRDPGTFYLSLRTSDFPNKGTRPFVLEVFVSGDEEQADPSASPSATQTPSSTASRTAPATSAPLDLPPPESGGGAGVFLGVLLLLALLGGFGYVLWRRRQAALDGPPPPEYY